MSRCVYGHPYATVELSYGENHGFVSIVVAVEYDELETGEYVLEARAFPGQAGIGKTKEEAFDSLRHVFGDWLDSYLNINGPAAFQALLGERLGFGLIAQPIVPKTDDDELMMLGTRHIPGGQPDDTHV